MNSRFAHRSPGRALTGLLLLLLVMAFLFAGGQAPIAFTDPSVVSPAEAFL